MKKAVVPEPQPLSRAKKHGGALYGTQKERAEGKQLSWSKKPELVDALYDDGDTTDEEPHIPEENTSTSTDGNTAANTPTNESSQVTANAADNTAAAAASNTPNANHETTATTKPKK